MASSVGKSDIFGNRIFHYQEDKDEHSKLLLFQNEN